METIPPENSGPEASAHAAAGLKAKAKASWERLQRELAEHLARLNAERLKEALLACGIGTGVALLIIVLAKVLPIAIVLLALVGVSLTCQLWQQVRIKGPAL